MGSGNLDIRAKAEGFAAETAVWALDVVGIETLAALRKYWNWVKLRRIVGLARLFYW